MKRTDKIQLIFVNYLNSTCSYSIAQNIYNTIRMHFDLITQFVSRLLMKLNIDFHLLNVLSGLLFK